MSNKPTSHKSCCIPRCRLIGRQNDTDEKKISYHTFPFDEAESLAWLKNICAADKSHIELFPNSRVCSRHFRDEDYVPNLPNGRIRLKPGVLPTVFEWTSVNTSEEEMSDKMMMDESNPVGFTVHVAHKKSDDNSDISVREAAVASSAISTNIDPQVVANVDPPQSAGLDLSTTSKAFIALQSPPGLAIPNKASQGLQNSSPNSNTNSPITNSLPMEQDGEETLSRSDEISTINVPQEQCFNCEALEGELSRASIELTNLQREKVLLHAKCAELEDEVQKIHVYCKQLKALNDHLQLVTAKDKEEKAHRARRAAELEALVQHQMNQSTQAQQGQVPSMSPDGMIPGQRLAASLMAIGKGRRKQSNPMKRPRDNEAAPNMSNGVLTQPTQQPDGTDGTPPSANESMQAKVPALDLSNNPKQESVASVATVDASTQTNIEGTDISGMKDENDLLSGVLTDERRLHRTLFVKSIMSTNENVKTFTGIPTKEGLEVLFEVLMDHEMMNLHWQSRPGDTMMAAQKKAYLSVNRRGMSSLSPFHDFLITLIRLNLGLKHVVLSSLFGCSTAKTSTVCRSWIEYMRSIRENTMIGKLLAHLPLDVQKSERVEQHMISLPPLVSETQWIGICRSFLDRHKNIKTEIAQQPETLQAIAPKLSPSTSLGIKVKETKAGAGIVLENYHSHIKRERGKGNSQLSPGLHSPLPPLAIKQEPGLSPTFDPNLLNAALAASNGAQGLGGNGIAQGLGNNGMMYLLANGSILQDYSKLALTVPQFPSHLLPMSTAASIPPSLQALAQVGSGPGASTPTIDLSEATSGKSDILQPKVANTTSAEDIARAFGIESVAGLVTATKSEPQA